MADSEEDENHSSKYMELIFLGLFLSDNDRFTKVA
jgi:hypothetical protein